MVSNKNIEVRAMLLDCMNKRRIQHAWRHGPEEYNAKPLELLPTEYTEALPRLPIVHHPPFSYGHGDQTNLRIATRQRLDVVAQD